MVNETLQAALTALQGQIKIAENALKQYRTKLAALESGGKNNSAEYQQTKERADSLRLIIDHYRSVYEERKALLNAPMIEKRRRTRH